MENYYNADSEKIGKIVAGSAAGLAAVGGLVSAMKSQPKSDVKQACGRRPILKGKRKQWDECVARHNAPPVQATKAENPKKMSTTTIVIISIGAVVAIGGIILLARKK